MKLKAIFLSGIITASILSVNVYADETTPATDKIETTTTSVQTQVQTEPTESSTVIVHGSSGSIPIDDETAKSPEFFKEIMEYVGEDNAANLNENLKNNALTINSTTIDYSDKSMFTITTRSGDVFYLIINNSDGSCLFLNAVDTADLTSMLNNGSTQNQFNENVIEEMQKAEKETMSYIENSNDTASSETNSEAQKSKGEKSIFGNLLLILGAVVLCAAIAGIWTVIKKKKRNSNSSYDKEMYGDYSENNSSDNSDEEIVEYQEDDPE